MAGKKTVKKGKEKDFSRDYQRVGFLVFAIVVCGLLLLNTYRHEGTVKKIVDETPAKTAENISNSGLPAVTPSFNEGQAPLPAPPAEVSYLTLILAIIAVLLISSIVTLSGIIIGRKKKMATQFDQLINSAYASLSTGDRMAAMNDYKVLIELFSKSRDKMFKKDALRIHGEGMKIYSDLLKK